MPGGGAKRWCFTSYRVKEPITFDEGIMAYLCYGRETCPETGRRHLQGFICFKNRSTIAKIKDKETRSPISNQQEAASPITEITVRRTATSSNSAKCPTNRALAVDALTKSATPMHYGKPEPDS